MFLHSSSIFPPLLQYAVTIDLLATVILCLTAAICGVLLYNILSNLLQWLQDIRPGADHRRLDHHASSSSSSSFAVQYNAQFVDALERFVRDIDERRGQRLRALNRLPPLISYGGREKRPTSGGGDECVICLEDFEYGESCQVFPVCNHIFHTGCIDHWLTNRPTCPVCRNCILEV